jgi:hypothetical protein
MIETTRTQFFKYVVGAMVIINMNSMSQKIIGRKTCLLTRGFFKLSRDFESKKHSNTWRKEESKQIKDFIKLKKGSVHRKRYDGHCTKQ